MDAASLLVPTSSSFYYEVRPEIAIAKPSADLASALPLTADWGLHPALRETLYPLYQQGELAFVPFSGTDDLSRSHFETQDSIEMGQSLSGPRDYRSGFMNRLAAELDSREAISFTDQLPLVFRGAARVSNAALRDNIRPALEGKARELLMGMYSGNPLAPQVGDGFGLSEELMRELSPAKLSEMDTSGRNAVNTTGFEREARRVARLMRGRFSLGFVDVGGWDTHAGQGAATGALAKRFEELGRGLAAIASELGPALWRQTTVMVISEFGRTFRENGNRGTDHGHGSTYLLLGGGLKGSVVAGAQVALSAGTLHQNRDYPVLNEYRALLGGLWQRQFGLSKAALERVFPGAPALDLGLV